MDWLPEAIRIVAEAFGITGFILLVAAGLIVAAMYFHNRNKSDPSNTPMADIVTPVTCKWSEVERQQISTMARRIEDIDDRQRLFDRDLQHMKDLMRR